jgi:hypothetical protein
MVIGQRRIRSAGRRSGSIEVTLPAQLQALEGVECRLLLRDGPRPEIVLQPDLSVALGLFRRLWGLLRSGIADPELIGDLDLAQFSMSLFPTAWQERPPLACADALAVLRSPGAGASDPDALARLLAALAAVQGQHLGLDRHLAPAFGAAIASAMLGVATNFGADFEAGMARQQFVAARLEPGAPLDPHTWQLARPVLLTILDQFQTWQAQPATYTAARDRWFKGLAAELR